MWFYWGQKAINLYICANCNFCFYCKKKFSVLLHPSLYQHFSFLLIGSGGHLFCFVVQFQVSCITVLHWTAAAKSLERPCQRWQYLSWCSPHPPPSRNPNSFKNMAPEVGRNSHNIWHGESPLETWLYDVIMTWWRNGVMSRWHDSYVQTMGSREVPECQPQVFLIWHQQLGNLK